MCRNIKTLFNFDPPATHAEIHGRFVALSLTRRCLAGKAAARRLRPADRIGKPDAGTRRSPDEVLARDDRGEGNAVHRSNNFLSLVRRSGVSVSDRF